VLTMSEFGPGGCRDGNRGTDHWPRQRDDDHRRSDPWREGLRTMARPRARTTLRGRDLSVSTDFRAVFSEVVSGHLGLTDTRTVFSGIRGAVHAGFCMKVGQRNW